MLEKGPRDVVGEHLRDAGCLHVEYEVKIGRGRARGDVAGYIFKKNKMVPVVLVETQLVFSLEPIYKLMANADKLGVETLAVTDGAQWTWYQKVEGDWRRAAEAPNFADLMTISDIIACRDQVMSRTIDELLEIFRKTRRADLGDLGMVLYAHLMCKVKQIPDEELYARPQEVFASVMEDSGFVSQWSRVNIGSAELVDMIRVVERLSPLLNHARAEGLYEAIFAQRQLAHATHGMLAKAIATLLCGILPQKAQVLDPAAGEGAVLTATMLVRDDLQFAAMDENAATGFLARLLFETKQVGLSFEQRDFVRSSPLDLRPFDAIVLDPPVGARIEAQEVLRQYELARGKSMPIEVLFIERGIAQVKPGGYFVAVAPAALLMRAADKHVREYMLRECHVEAVLDIPKEFGPMYTKKCLIVLRKRSEDVAPGEYVIMLWLDDRSNCNQADMFRDAIAELVQRLQIGNHKQ